MVLSLEVQERAAGKVLAPLQLMAERRGASGHGWERPTERQPGFVRTCPQDNQPSPKASDPLPRKAAISPNGLTPS
jgi:hypothetical protein